MAKTAAEIIQEANDRIKEDISDTFKDVKLPEDEDKDEKSDDDKASDDKLKDKSDKDKDEGDKDDKSDEDESDDKSDDKVDDKSDDDKSDDDDKGEEDDDKGDKDEDPALAQLQAQNEALLTQVEALSGQVFAGPEVASKEDDKVDDKKDDKVDDKADDKKPKVIQFVDQESFEEATSSPEGLNALLTKAVALATDEGERRGYERAIRETPALVEQLTEKSVGAREAVRDFLSANKDLIPVRAFVGLVTNELRAANPDWPLEKLFNKAGEVVRERLKLSKVAEEINDEKGSDEGNPAFPQRGTKSDRGTTKSKLTSLQKEIAELEEVASTRG